ncbi:MAG TPA: CHRD domain-containing protein, partial [Pyrinomonadaceae bacterium]|nr:CHRD domain-containing protein [Pyrinomonadaceae bacterium]
LYIVIGDNGRRGFLQNVTSGGTVPDDQFGGPEPDDAHLTGVILRLNDDGTTPTDNPFFSASTNLTGQAAANIKKIFAYGVRNSFGMAFDPVSGKLWTEENGDDAFDEINRVPAGFNGGWVQIIGPSSRISEYKSIESTYGARNLQQIRWSPTLIADTPQQAISRLYMLPGAQYVEPEFSWKYAVAPATLGFVRGQALGAQYDGDMFVGASRTFLSGGFLFRFKLTSDRLHLSTTDPRLADRVADNLDKFDITESESLLIGRDFGITTDIQTGPNGNLFVVSNTNNAVYEISAKPPAIFTASLNGAQEIPPNNLPGFGSATLLLSPDETTAKISLSFGTLSSAETAAHIHGPAAPGASANVLFPLPLGQFSDYQISLTPQQVQDLKNGLFYVNVHTVNNPNGEIRGQFGTSPSASTVEFNASDYTIGESGGNAVIVVTRFGNTSTSATVDFTTSNGTASDRSDYTFNAGTLQFAPGETSKAFLVSVTDDAYVEGNETLNVVLSNPTGGILLASPATATLTILDNDTQQPAINPIDDAQVFVRQHYLDFLSREPDEGGLAYWTARINECGSDQSCLVRRRSEVSAAFFIEQEFQQTGFFIYRLYKASYGRQPAFQEFINDRTHVVAGANLDTTKTLFAESFVQRPEFTFNYSLAQQGPAFVDALITKVGNSSNVDLNQHRSELIAEYNLGTSQVNSRARVLRKLIEYPEYVQAETNPAFVLSQYFLYLRRDADAGGYQFWLDILNNRVPGNYLAMVCAFLTSAEYQQRFSPVVTRRNSDCGGI